MPKDKLNTLSDVKIKNLKASIKDYIVNDGGGLYLRVRPHGVKEWIFRYTSPKDNRRRKQSIGPYPDVHLKEAREAAFERRKLIAKGLDPAFEIMEDKRLKQAKLEGEKTRAFNTVFAMFYQWKKEGLQNRKDKGKEAERIFKKDVFPLVGDKHIDEVTKDDIKMICNQAKNRNANNRLANLILTELKQFYRYLQDEENTKNDPTRVLRKDRTGGKEKPRKRYLKENDLKVLHDKLQNALLGISTSHKPSLKKCYVHIILLHLATGCRRNEIATANHKNIDLNKKNFHIPADKSKNTDEHDIYLSDFALHQIRAISNYTMNKTWLLPHTDGYRPLSEGVLTNQIRERQPKVDKQGNILKSSIHDNSLELPNGKWILHDLRRTAATIMQKLGVNPYVVKKCLNQRVADKMIETYQHAEYLGEQREAFEKLGKFLEEIFY